MKLLTNHPLEAFDAREHYPDFHIVSYGPRHRVRVGHEHFPADVEFDPEHGTIEALLGKLPAGFEPDCLLLYWPDQDPIPAGLERCPVPVVGVFSDYNLMFHSHAALWPFFDRAVCDLRGLRALDGLGFARLDYWCQFSQRTAVHRIYPGAKRDLDVTFVGNLNPAVQPERLPWIERVCALADRCRVEVRQGPSGIDYGRLLSRSKIGFNRSIRGEMNLRAFEVPACGALLLMERENEELARFFQPGRECVTYGSDDLERRILWLLEHEDERAAIAARGHARAQEHAYRHRLRTLRDLLQTTRSSGRPASTAFERHLGRGVSMLCTWAMGQGAFEELIAAARLRPLDPRPHNAIACDLVRRGQDSNLVYQTLRHACVLDPEFTPARLNLAWLLELAGDSQRAVDLLAPVAAGAAMGSLDGPVLPLGFHQESVFLSNARMRAAELRQPELLRAATMDLARWRRERMGVAATA